MYVSIPSYLQLESTTVIVTTSAEDWLWYYINIPVRWYAAAVKKQGKRVVNVRTWTAIGVVRITCSVRTHRRIIIVHLYVGFRLYVLLLQGTIVNRTKYCS